MMKIAFSGGRRLSQIPYLDVLLLKGSADGICAGVCIAGTDVDFFGGTGAGTVVIYAVGYIAGNTDVLMAGFAGLFRRIVVHFFKILSIKKIMKDVVLS